MKGSFKKNGKKLRREQMTQEQKEEVCLYDRWKNSKEKQILDEYAGKSIEEVPEEYKEKIAKLREFGLGKKEKTVYEEVIEFLKINDGRFMRTQFSKNGKVLKREELTEEQQNEINLYARWKNSKEKQILDEYAGKSIEEVPEEYREKIAKLREFGLGKKEKTVYEEVIEFLKIHDGRFMQSTIYKNEKKLKREEMTEEQKKEVNLYQRWFNCKEKQILEEYAGKSIEEVPEEYREKIAKLREFGLGKKEKTVYEEVIEFLKIHDGRFMRSIICKNEKIVKRNEMTEEEKTETRLYQRWLNCKEKQILDEYAGKSIEEVPEEYREKIAKLRKFGLGEKEKTVYEEVIEFLETHDGKIMAGQLVKNGRTLKSKEMTKEQKEEVNLYARWRKSQERQILKEYAGKSIEEVPEEYREKIAKLRKFGLGEKEKTVYEEVIEFLETHNGKIMTGAFGRGLKRNEMTEEQKKEINLYARWRKSQEKQILEEYVGKSIEEVPEEYREKIAKLREFGLGMKKSKLLKAKQERDEAKEKNDAVRQLEEEVEKELKKRGKLHE